MWVAAVLVENLTAGIRDNLHVNHPVKNKGVSSSFWKQCSPFQAGQLFGWLERFPVPGLWVEVWAGVGLQGIVSTAPTCHVTSL